MSDSESQPVETEPSPAPLVADDQLPPVQPPSAGFILQLFVVPGVIVAAIVAVWLMFSWIVHRASARPDDVVQGLEGSGPSRWQRASELADMLRNDRYRDFRKDSAAAQHLADILDRELTAATSAGGMDDGAVNLRYFLCRALGEFEVTDGMDVLLRAATTSRDPREQWVRRGAIQAIAVLAYNQLHGDPSDDLDHRDLEPTLHPDLEPTLFRLAGDKDDLIRSQTAFAMGRIATPALLERLEIMVNDPHADTRYNAAVGLAQHGNPVASETLAEMLDPDNRISIQEEEDVEAEVVKRAVIMKNAMQAAVTLSRQQPDGDYTVLREVLDAVVQLSPTELRQARIDPLMQAEAKRTLEFLNRADR